MKKYFISFLFVSFLVASAIIFNFSIPEASAVTQPTSISQLIELLITIGVIAPDKVAAARAAATNLSRTVTVTPPVASALISTSTSYVQVLSPNGTEKWEMGVDVAYSIRWGSTGLSSVRVSLIGSKNSVCDLSPTSVVSKDGTNTFKLLLKNAKCYNPTTATSTLLKDGSYKVRVSYTDSAGHTVKDESNGTFTISQELLPSLKITYPNGGESLTRNTDYTVKYTLKNVTNTGMVYLYLLDNVGNIAFNSHKSPVGGTYKMELPSNLTPGAYKVQLKTETGDRVDIEDISDNFFWISSGL